ncbi:MAG: ferrous iron transport protein A [Firmicutes bacterium]|nr:ferrous iron transport protein A [Bacillota bacterium]
MRRRRKTSVSALNTLADGARGTIVDIVATGPMRHQIFSLGLVEGTDITVRAKNPLNKSVSVLVKDRNLNLYKELAKKILIELEN